MAVTTQDSTQFGNFKQTPPVQNPAMDDAGRTRVKAFNFTQSGQGDDGSFANLARMPGGKCRILMIHIEHSAFGASRVLNIGHGGYTDSDGNAVVADPDYFVAGLDVATAGDSQQHMDKFLDTPRGWTLKGQITGGTMDDGNTLNGWVLYAVD